MKQLVARLAVGLLTHSAPVLAVAAENVVMATGYCTGTPFQVSAAYALFTAFYVWLFVSVFPGYRPLADRYRELSHSVAVWAGWSGWATSPAPVWPGDVDTTGLDRPRS